MPATASCSRRALGIAVLLLVLGTAKAELTHYYPFDVDAGDVVGHDHGDIIMGGITTEPNQVAVGSGAADLRHGEAYVDLPAIDFGDRFSIAAWVAIVVPEPEPQTIIANSPCGNLGRNDGFRFYVNTWGNPMEDIVFENGDGVDVTRPKTRPWTFASFEYQHVAITVDRPNGRARIYHNGVLANRHDTKTLRTFSTHTPDTRIGVMTCGYFHLRGFVDDVRIYDHLLSEDEIAHLVPEPGALSVLAVGGLALIRRRR